ncbi:heavy metal translocating P-type ATPase [Brasilonema octagenarum UFV-E1]|uniref:Heavy metal translocating P-type ATPase n=1 Tax=Brasilonema sennae CENA114 TaxID=415709 RepID=A0A856MPK2_9CYAN|nr:heavy metal translocating P-type ATPase [Brasilonema sennae]QDL12030.1 heavy metal translocating P-type ATPase [Brasilonema sennae CENA114]QDL18405.1 heavy metal translocating P-type ATPase [Brasilonema octagenarum UFV-E1]
MAKLSVQLPTSRGHASQVAVAAKNGISRVESNGHSNGHPEVKSSEVSYSIVHRLPERVRLRVPRLLSDADYAQRLQVLLEADTLVTSVRVKRAAASLTVTYKSSKVSDTKIRSHLDHLIQAASEVVVLKPSQPKPASDAEQKSWPGMQLSGLATALAVLGGPIGWSIPPVMVAGTIALATLPVFKRAWEGIRDEQKLNIDFLDFIAIAITTVQGQFLTPALMLSLIEIGENIRDRTARSSAQQTLDLLSSLGQFVWVERDGEKVQIPIQDVHRGDTVIVYPGEQVPVDGTILRGKALLDEQKLTGESMPVLKKKGQTVYASTLMREGRIYISAERVGNDTCAGQSIRLMQEAPVHDTRMENQALNIAQKAVVPTLLLGGAVFALTRNPARAASIFTLDLCTGIRVSIPTTVLAALTYSARHGVLIRSGRALEKLAEVDTIVFDKTGTLTKGEVAVVGVESRNPATSTTRVLELAAAAEQRLTHPVAEAIVRYAQEQGVQTLSRTKWDYQLGLGVRADIDGETVYVGSERYLRQEGVEMDLNGHQKQATSVIYVASNGQLQGMIEYSDVLRSESREVITALLTAEGVEVHMLTGDNKRTASAVASQLGIPPTHTHAEAFPEQKATVVRELHEQGKTVAFVGDGINDSPALAYADVSVSFANGSEIARETADVVLMENDLHGLLEAIEIARNARQIIQQNTTLIAVPNVAALAIAVLFGLNPLAATVVNNGSTVVAGVNGLRPILKNRKQKVLPSAIRR